MKKFARNKPFAEIKAQCKAQGLAFNDTLFRTRGYDHVVIKGGGAEVLYNTFNGRFFGVTDQGVAFNSDSTEHEKEPWFQALLSFFYTEDIKAAAPKGATTLQYMLKARAS